MTSDLIHIHRKAARLRRWISRSRRADEAISLDLHSAELHEAHISCLVRIAELRRAGTRAMHRLHLTEIGRALGHLFGCGDDDLPNDIEYLVVRIDDPAPTVLAQDELIDAVEKKIVAGD